MIYAAKQSETLLFRSMGKSFRILAIATTEDEANDYMRKHDEAAVIAQLGPFVFMADKCDPGQK